ncbi:hypothetical protein FACS1894202_01460 [Clostridia bacterium]|nr:hypothetical protein FACS1894202_01460 [Clostridia bacterium]
MKQRLKSTLIDLLKVRTLVTLSLTAGLIFGFAAGKVDPNATRRRNQNKGEK